ncbi:hypothetical protein [Microbacterium maritypicum]
MNEEELNATRIVVQRAVGGVLFNTSNFPAKVQTRLLGQDMSPLNDKLTTAIVNALAGMIRCDYCDGPLPSVRDRSHVPTVPALQRLGFAADKIVCPECVERRRNDGGERHLQSSNTETVPSAIVEVDWAEDETGKPIEGPIGPFYSERAADEWALAAIFNGEWNTARLRPPTPITIPTIEGQTDDR